MRGHSCDYRVHRRDTSLTLLLCPLLTPSISSLPRMRDMTLAMPACSCSLRCSTAISPPQTPDPLEEESIESGSTWAKGYLVSEPDPPSREGSGSETKGY